jgi:transposase
MKIDATSLTDDPKQLKRMLLELQAKTAQALAEKDKIITEQAIQINQFIERYEIAKRKQFGKSSEQLPGAGEIFNEAEELIDEADKQLLVEKDSNSNATVKNKPKRKPLPKALPRKVVTIDLSLDEKVCKCCQVSCIKLVKLVVKSLNLFQRTSK